MDDTSGGNSFNQMFSPQMLLGLGLMNSHGMQDMLPLMMRYGMMGGMGQKKPGMARPMMPGAAMPMAQVGMQAPGSGGTGMGMGGGLGLKMPNSLFDSGLYGGG